ncbi:hypothetical protein GX48_04057 [Paracoccidioides brasiliensis]|nr:hypothetical protein GX48_04057 [Paracoccidioides brasiliensis]
MGDRHLVEQQKIGIACRNGDPGGWGKSSGWLTSAFNIYYCNSLRVRPRHTTPIQNTNLQPASLTSFSEKSASTKIARTGNPKQQTPFATETPSEE